MGALDSQGNMYIADLFNARVQKLDANGQFLMAWGTPGSDDGQFFMPVTIVLDDAGRLYVATIPTVRFSQPMASSWGSG